jgi:hypothetical protein
VDDPRRDDRADDAPGSGQSVHEADGARGDAGLDQPHHRYEKHRVDDEIAAGTEDGDGPEVGPAGHVADPVDQVANRRARLPVAGRQVAAEPSDLDGSHRVTAQGSDETERSGDGVQETAERSADQCGDVLAGLVLAERCRQLLARNDRADGRGLGGCRHARDHASEQRDDHEVGQGEDGDEAGGSERGVGQHSKDVGRDQHVAPVEAVHQHAGGSSAETRPRRYTAPGRPASTAEPVIA